jgi:hypothetical protein
MALEKDDISFRENVFFRRVKPNPNFAKPGKSPGWFFVPGDFPDSEVPGDFPGGDVTKFT